jgi:hypothetical protein
MDDIDWQGLTEGMEQIEAEFAATDERDPEAQAVGIPLWAYKAYLLMQQVRDEAEEEGQGEVPDPDTAAKLFLDGFVNTLTQAEVSVELDGEPKKVPRDLRGRVTIGLEARSAFSLFMALRVAAATLQATGPMALMMAGLQPSLTDAAEVAELSKTIASAMQMVCAEETVGGKVDARAHA